ncbi:SDR family NAD(P)-dependent oxidoreductase [Prescottella defluvii]|nr:SDR family NAD(P)-dependent oxidoreductase [Prescottella defluvii]
MGYFDRRVVAITGAGTGMGRELAIRLARSGAALALSGNVEGPLTETAERCTNIGARVSATVVDVTDREAVSAFAASTVERFGRVDAVINNAGILYTGDVLASEYVDVERVMDVDLAKRRAE